MIVPMFQMIRKPGINRQKLGNLVFNEPTFLAVLNGMMEKPILVRLVDALRKASGLVLVESALFAEAGILRVCNNNMILVNVSDEDQHQRLKDRKYDEKQIQRRISSQYDAEETRYH